MSTKELKGEIEKILFKNEENGFIVARFKTQERKIVILGTLPFVYEGEEIKIEGFFEKHPVYGERFKVTSFEPVQKTNVEGIERYLSSGIIKGIGPQIAKRIVERFGEETFSIIEGNSERLKEIEGIGEKKLELIRKGFFEERTSRDLIAFLLSYGITLNTALKIIKTYGRQTRHILEENPYKIARDIKGIGFLKADRIAESFGIPKDSPLRAKAGILYKLESIAEDGHTCYPIKEFLEDCSRDLKIEEGVLSKALSELLEEREVEIEERDEVYVYPKDLFLAEVSVADKIKRIKKEEGGGHLDLKVPFDRIERDMGLRLSLEQKQAIEASFREKILIVTGGPGTGKTTIIKAIILLSKTMGLKPVLAAPTGRAAKRLTEVTGFEAKTIHRLLEFNPEEKSFRRNEKNPLEGDIFIIDEVSMIDLPLMANLLHALTPKKRVILVGDADQLPSVGPGNLLRDLISSNFIPVIRLKDIFRQSLNSMIVLNAHRINNGLMPFFREEKGLLRDFFFIEVEDTEAILNKIKGLCLEGVEALIGKVSPLRDIQVLTPMYKGPLGVNSINSELQRILNTEREYFQIGQRFFKLKDRVMQLKNNYEKEVFNGDVGFVVGIDKKKESLEIDFDGRILSYTFDEIDELSLAYASSIHKAQGSEFPVIIMPVVMQHYILLQRNLLYTGITRGKRLVILLGTKKALAIAIKNDKERRRYSLLKERFS